MVMRRYIILGIVVVMVVAAGIAVAQVGDDGIIYACASEKDGTLRLIDSSEDCGKKETPIFWNAEGPPGPAGADGVDGVDGADGADAQVGEIVMTTSGNAWFAQGTGGPFERWATETTFLNAPGRAVISLTGPGAVSGVEYGLASFDLCVITNESRISAVTVTGTDWFGVDVDDSHYLGLFREDIAPSDGLTTGCHTYDVNKPVGQGAGLMVEFVDWGSDANSVTLASVRSVWTPEAAQD